MTASILKQDPNTKRFKRTLIYFDTDTQYANFRRNPLCTVFSLQALPPTVCNEVSIVPTIIDSDEKKNADINIVIFHVQCVR